MIFHRGFVMFRGSDLSREWYFNDAHGAMFMGQNNVREFRTRLLHVQKSFYEEKKKKTKPTKRNYCILIQNILIFLFETLGELWARV